MALRGVCITSHEIMVLVEWKLESLTWNHCRTQLSVLTKRLSVPRPWDMAVLLFAIHKLLLAIDLWLFLCRQRARLRGLAALVCLQQGKKACCIPRNHMVLLGRSMWLVSILDRCCEAIFGISKMKGKDSDEKRK